MKGILITTHALSVGVCERERDRGATTAVAFGGGGGGGGDVNESLPVYGTRTCCHHSFHPHTHHFFFLCHHFF